MVKEIELCGREGSRSLGAGRKAGAQASFGHRAPTLCPEG